MSYFDFDNKRIYYTIEGSGKPLLLLHGNTASSIIDADTEAVVAHAKTIGSFFHKPMKI